MKTDFTFDDVFPPEKSLDPWVFVERQMKASAVRCGPIDARIDTLEAEFGRLVKEFHVAEADFANAKGFWRQWKCKRILKRINERICINRDLRHALYFKRWQNT